MLIFLLGTKHNLCFIRRERCVMLILLFVGIFYQLWLYAGEVTIVMEHWWWWWWLSLTMQWVFWEQCSITQHVQTCLSSVIDRTNDYWSMCSGSYWSRWWGWFWYWFSEGIWRWKLTAYIWAISSQVGLFTPPFLPLYLEKGIPVCFVLFTQPSFHIAFFSIIWHGIPC